MIAKSWVGLLRESLDPKRKRLSEPVPVDENGVAVSLEDDDTEAEAERQADRPDGQGGAGPVAV